MATTDPDRTDLIGHTSIKTLSLDQTPTTFTLEAGDAAYIVRADGNAELIMPDLGDDDEADIPDNVGDVFAAAALRNYPDLANMVHERVTEDNNAEEERGYDPAN